MFEVSAQSKGDEQYWFYNGMDCALTRELRYTLHASLDDTARKTYQFEMSLQAPALEMMLRGVRINTNLRHNLIVKFEAQKSLLEGRLNRLAQSVWDRDLNPRSSKQLVEFFYETMNLPKQYNHTKGKSTLTTDDNALQSLSVYFYATPFTSHIQKIRSIGKTLSFLKTPMAPDGRMRTSFHVAGTESGRWSSSESVWGDGTNLQNVTESLRRLVIADEGMKFCNIDKEQAESRVVGALAYRTTGQDKYLRACESGDLHTTTARMVFKDLPWTEDLIHDKAVAEELFYRHFSYRDMSKRGGHGSNYGGKARTIASHLKVPTQIIEDFQDEYFTEFPEILEWQKYVAQELLRHGYITTLTDRRRYFLGRRTDDATIREAIAYEPQSVVGDDLNSGLLALWQSDLPIQILLQVHDSILFQYPEDTNEPELFSQVQALLERPIYIQRRDTGPLKDITEDVSFTIPVEFKTGWNWGNYSDANPNGLKKYSPGEERGRVSEGSILDRQVR